MKKVLFFIAVSAIIFSATAQNKKGVLKNQTFAKKNIVNDYYQSLGPVQESKVVSTSIFSTSLNGLTTYSGNKLNADQQSKTILYTARAGGAYGATGNDIKMSFTTNYGVSFDSILYSNSRSNRYPGGTLFRKSDGLFVMCSGPITGGDGWEANYLFTSKIDGTFPSDTFFNNPPNTEVGSFMLHDKHYILPTGEAFILGEKNGPDPFPHINYSIWNLKWNSTSNSFNFVDSNEFTPLLSKAAPQVQPYGMAFSADGSIGYFWVNHADSITRPNYRTQPLVWKTIDKGETWNQMPIVDYGKTQGMKDNLFSLDINDTIITPVFWYGYVGSEGDMPGTVDANGNLHLLVKVFGAVSNHPDSLFQQWTAQPDMLMDLYTTNNEIGWDAMLIDTLSTDVKIGSEAPAIYGTNRIDHRFHIGKSDDGLKIFYMWTDTDPVMSGSTVNTMPNFKASAINLTTSLKTGTKNFTAGTDLDGSVFWMNASDIVLFDNNKYIMPVVGIVPSTTSPDDPISHKYFSGIEFNETDFGGNPAVKDIDKDITKVSQNYPNPSNGNTNIDVVLSKNSSLSIDVINLMGQTVYTENRGNVAAGKHKISINTNSFNSGIYFYTVKAGNSVYTNKMIVK